MAHYIAFIDGKPGAYGAVLPDAPGCTAMGGTSDEVIQNAIEALREWMADRRADGLPDPAPRAFEAICEDDASGWDRSQTLAHIPLLLDAGRSVRVNVSMDAALVEQIDTAAKQRGLTRSAFLASAAREKIVARR